MVILAKYNQYYLLTESQRMLEATATGRHRQDGASFTEAAAGVPPPLAITVAATGIITIARAGHRRQLTAIAGDARQPRQPAVAGQPGQPKFAKFAIAGPIARRATFIADVGGLQQRHFELARPGWWAIILEAQDVHLFKPPCLLKGVELASWAQIRQSMEQIMGFIPAAGRWASHL